MNLRFSITVSVKLPTFVVSMISVKSSSLRAVVLSSLLATALLLSPVSAFADFRPDSSFAVDSPVVLSTLPSALGTAYITRAALGALGIEIAGSLPELSPEDVARALWSGGGPVLPPTYTYASSLAEYLNRETIRIRPDSVTIGGVEYSDVWLPHDAADKFRTNAFDFVTRYNLSSESNGTFVSGVGTFNGFPVYQLSDGQRVTQGYATPSSSHGSLFDYWSYSNDSPSTSSTQYQVRVLNPTGSIAFATYCPNSEYMIYRLSVSSTYGSLWWSRSDSSSSSWGYTQATLSGSFISEPFDFTWVSGVIPAEPLPDLDGLRFRVPATVVSALPIILDPSSSTYDADLAALIDGLNSAAADGTLTDPAFEEWDAPVPPTSNTIADEPYSSLSGALSGISEFLDSISTSVSNVAEAILSGDTSFFGNIVSALATPFEPVFSIFRSGVGIWRYVVSWVGSISAPFSWSLSALSGAGSIFMTPIYAAAAGAVVLAVYKKFGR